MSGDKLNTAEHDSKGRCIRHPDIRLRKKKLLGGWKILIGHCPECCLDEMRRVRDEIDGAEGKKKKKDKKKHGKKSKKPERGGSDEISKDGVSMTSEGHDHNIVQGRHHGKGARYREDGESEATGSTAQMSGGGSVVSEQYYREGGVMSPGHGHRHHYSSDNFRGYHQPHHHAQPMYQQAPMMGHQERTMVLSMTFIDPQTGQRGTYTGQVNSINHKPDGKGTVYYNNGTIAEGSWSNGILTSDGSEEEESQASYDRSRSCSRPRTRESSRSASKNRGPPEQDAGFGNLHLLNRLPGSKSRPSGASASVQSYNSRTSHVLPSGSASVQADYSGEGGIYGGGMGHYAPPPRRTRRTVNSPPMMNKRGEYEP